MATHTIFDKSKLPSRHATVGPDRAPHRLVLLRHGPEPPPTSRSRSSAW